jgi:hypothetical protein
VSRTEYAWPSVPVWQTTDYESAALMIHFRAEEGRGRLDQPFQHSPPKLAKPPELSFELNFNLQLGGKPPLPPAHLIRRRFSRRSCCSLCRPPSSFSPAVGRRFEYTISNRVRDPGNDPTSCPLALTIRIAYEIYKSPYGPA